MNLPNFVEITGIHYRPETGDWQIEILGEGEIIKETPLTVLSDVGEIFQKAVHEMSENVPAKE
jgi:hypothetical protein